jgi:hypothetical protein
MPKRKNPAVRPPKPVSKRSSMPAAALALRIPSQQFTLSDLDGLKRAALEWTYTVRSRQRWAMRSDTAEQKAQQAAAFLNQVGLDDVALTAIGRAGSVEVSMSWISEEANWEARIFPWEYVLAGATHGMRAGAPLTVVRHLDVRRPPVVPPKKRRPLNALFVVSEPGALRGLYEFTEERDLVRSQLGPSANWMELRNPMLGELSENVAAFRPDIVHLAGFDTHQAFQILLARGEEVEAARLLDAIETPRKGEEIPDGYILRASSDRPDPISADRLSLALNTGHSPRLVSFNIFNSAARIAPLTVSRGAGAAIGFQDEFDEELAETFFSTMYSYWRTVEWDAPFAFTTAWETVRTRPGQVAGTGVVLWNASPLFPAPSANSEVRSRARRAKLDKKLTTASSKDLAAADVPLAKVEDCVSVSLRPLEDLNYSLLHNKRPLFERFVLNRKTSDTVRDIRVKVSLSVGNESASFERTLSLDRPTVELRRDIHIPLTSALTRSVHESVRTGLFVEVCWGAHVLHRDTYSVRIVPVDQWRDSRDDRLWLPSFVFPRDPAVSRIIDAAQRYLKVLRDDPAAGFDGYQSVNPKKPETTRETDVQVQAIWSAIVHDLRLSYINPPPGYSSELDSQRLRTPSMVCREKSGTCIDLALLFAACLELVDIYPVIFLLDAHAFVGYWRAFEFHEDFADVQKETIANLVNADSKTTSASGAQSEGWFLGKATYHEILRHVNAGRLVPIEAVRLTEASGFAEARADGRENLRVQREFEALVDLAMARDAQVTPLPIWGEQT